MCDTRLAFSPRKSPVVFFMKSWGYHNLTWIENFSFTCLEFQHLQSCPRCILPFCGVHINTIAGELSLNPRKVVICGGHTEQFFSGQVASGPRQQRLMCTQLHAPTLMRLSAVWSVYIFDWQTAVPSSRNMTPILRIWQSLSWQPCASAINDRIIIPLFISSGHRRQRLRVTYYLVAPLIAAGHHGFWLECLHNCYCYYQQASRIGWYHFLSPRLSLSYGTPHLHFPISRLISELCQLAFKVTLWWSLVFSPSTKDTNILDMCCFLGFVSYTIRVYALLIIPLSLGMHHFLSRSKCSVMQCLNII